MQLQSDSHFTFHAIQILSFPRIEAALRFSRGNSPIVNASASIFGALIFLDSKLIYIYILSCSVVSIIGARVSSAQYFCYRNLQ